MGLFVCAKCNCVENTALGWYWSKDNIRLVLPEDMKEYETGKPLCSECLPNTARFEDEQEVRHFQNCGKWHGKFPKVDYDQWKNTEEGKHYRRDEYRLTYIG